MDRTPNENLARTRLLIFILGLLVFASIAFWMFGNPIDWVVNLFQSQTTTESPSNTPLTLPTVLGGQTWQSLALHGALPLTPEPSIGRDNPFIGVEQQSKPTDRDTERVADIKAIRDALRSHKLAYGQYPDGTNVIIGSPDAACLTSKGWQPRTVCVFNVGVVPMPADPGQSSYMYSTTPDGYEVTFSLEEQSDGLSPGVHTLTPTEIK